MFVILSLSYETFKTSWFPSDAHHLIQGTGGSTAIPIYIEWKRIGLILSRERPVGEWILSDTMVLP